MKSIVIKKEIELKTEETEEQLLVSGNFTKEIEIVKKESGIVKSEECSVKKETKVGNNKPKGGRKKEENKKKIIAYMVEQLRTLDLRNISKQEIAEACGYMKCGSHGFSYAYSELKAEGMILTENRMGKLTDKGICSVPKEKFTFAQPKNNAEQQQHYYKLLRKRCKEGTDEKTKIIFEILSDGKPHKLREFTRATGYVNVKSKGLGYNLTCMEKVLKILKKPEKDVWQFTDKCFPKGRPE